MSVFRPQLPLAADVSRAVRWAQRMHPDPAVLGYHPVARLNPYQALLYSEGFNHGIAPLPVVRRSDFGALTVAPAIGGAAALHVHWTAGVTAAAADATEAKRLADGFIAELERLKLDGVRLLWTVHNALPHECAHPDAEISLRMRLIELTDAIHVMNEDTPSLVAEHYDLPPEKVFTVPHPSYIGAYPDHFDRATAKFDAGFEPDDIVLGLVGAIRPYKGIEEFLGAVAAGRRRNPRLRGVVAGIPGVDDASRQLVDTVATSPAVLGVARRLSAIEMAEVLAALDAVVLPYAASLNSGAALLAATFGLPTIAPRIGHFVDLAERGLCLAYEPNEADALERALDRAPDFVATFDASAARSFASTVSPTTVSSLFLTSVRKLLFEES